MNDKCFWGLPEFLLLVRGFKRDVWRQSGIDGPSKCSVSPGALTAAADEVIMLWGGGDEKESRL